jgi:hypothetical protein
MRHLLFGVLGLVLTAGPVAAAGPKELDPLAFLLGTWNAAGGGAPGTGTGATTFSRSLQDRVIVRTNHADYPATAKSPASRHDDLMIIHVDSGGSVRADYYDNEGHSIRYVVSFPAPGEATFVSDPGTGSSRFRLGYRLGTDGVLKGEFAVAPPASPEAFAPYLSWDSRRAAAAPKPRP